MARFAVIRDGTVTNVVEARRVEDCAHLGTVVPAPDEIGRDWRYDGSNFSEPSSDVAPVKLAEYVAERRWEKETGGFVWNECPVHSDDRSQSKYQAEVVAIDQGIRRDGEYWKFADGVPRPLTNAEMIELAIAARAHVKGCFATEFSVLSQIAAGTITTTAQVDAAFA